MSTTEQPTIKHSEGVYITAFETWAETGRYSEVASQMGVSPSTAKRWARIGGELWCKQNASAVRTVIAQGQRVD